MFLSAILYFSFHFSALAGVPVTMAARRQVLVFCGAGAIWLVARLPSPTTAKPSFLSSARAVRPRMLKSGTVSAAAPALFRNWRRWVVGMAVVPLNVEKWRASHEGSTDF